MPLRLSLSLILFLGTISALLAQSFTGQVTSADTGEPLPYASIYVKEAGTGTVTNEDGYYVLRLPRSGNFTIIFQYLGYTTLVKNVRASGAQSLNVELNSETFDLQTIEIVEGGEDPSYSVIRRAIAKADYHLNQVDKYTAQVYIKGSGRVKKVAKLLLAMVPKEDREEIDTSRVFTSESISNITYQRPNTFKQEVISTYQVGESPVDATPYLFATFYEPLIADAVSPLSTKAFGYYRFEHQGIFNDRGNNVNKIKVTPRSRGEDVFSGYINIVEGSWSIHSLELEVYKFGFRFGVSQTYAPVQDQVWMPVTTTVDLDGSILGISLEGSYIGTVSDYAISLNPDLPAYVEVIDEKTRPEEAAKVKKVNRTRDYEQRLEEGGELTRKELRRLMRTYEKEERKAAEEPKVESNYTFTQDSSKGVRDTAFWAAVRPVPLTEREVRSYAIEDSLAVIDSTEKATGIEVVSIEEAGTGDLTANTTTKTLGMDLYPQLDFFNAVEGYALGLGIGKKLKMPKGQALGLKITPRYGFAWKRATITGQMKYALRKNKKTTRFQLEGGRALRQYDASPAIEPIVGSLSMLFDHRNYFSFYERAYGRITISKKVSPAFDYQAAIAYEDRRRVRNFSDQSWFYTESRTYAPNERLVLARLRGDNQELPALAPSATFQLGASWKPGLKYEIDNGEKQAIEGSAPTLNFRYEAGIPGIGDSQSDFHHLQASYAHKFQMGIRGKVSLMLRGGAFLVNNFSQLPDFRHFATTEIIYTNADPIGSYRLLPYYTYSTDQEYGEAYVHYQFRKFLLSRIWSLQRRGIREDIFVNYLYTPDSQHYTELGYTIDNILRIFRLEFVTSWQDFEYQDFGVRLSVASIFSR